MQGCVSVDAPVTQAVGLLSILPISAFLPEAKDRAREVRRGEARRGLAAR